MRLAYKLNHIIMKALFVICVGLLIGISSCGHNAPEEKAMNVSLVEPPPPAEKEMVVAKSLAPLANADAKDYGKKIVKEGEVHFESKNISKTRTALYNSLVKLGGYIAEENQTNEGDSARKEYSLKIRVPANNFDQFLNSISTAAERIDSKNIRIKDVTSYYIDLSAQLVNKKALEARYLELLKRGTKIADLLAIENKVAEIRSDIDSTQGNLEYLKSQVAYSALDITFYIKPVVKYNEHSFGDRLITALSGGITALSSLLIGFVSLWPLWVLSVLGYFIFRTWKKRTTRKVAAEEAA